MREGPATVVRREDYAPPPYRIREVELTFDLDAAKTLVSSRLVIERDPGAPPQPLKLHGEELNLLRVLADGDSVSFRHEDGQLVIDAPPAGARFTLEIRNTIAPDKNTQLSGLYASGGGLFTQCEAEGFRRITYFLDRPDVMAVYTVTLRADKAKYPVLLANGNLVEHGDLDGGRHFATWHDPFPKPSYLFALVAADLVAREQKIASRAGREHLLQIYVRRGDLDKTEHAMRSLVAAVAWDEARFGLPLDLDRFMVVAVEDFNMGAMENKGLNIFNTKFVLASPATATDDDFAAIEGVVGHEYFHNWTGNRVTCRDWFQLSLKEGLTVYRDQEFSADMAGDASPPYFGAPSPATRAVKRIADVRQLRQLQFPEDAGPMAHPVRPDSYLEINNFYTATVYEKGAEVVRMMATLVGRDGFARGMTLYFQRHDSQAVTCDDFAQAIADANPGSELATRLDAFKRWYSQAGTPRVTARGTHDADARTYTLTLEQHCPPSPGQPVKQPFVIPVAAGLVGRDGRAVPLRLTPDGDAADERLLVLDRPSATWTFHGVEREPVPSLLRGFSAPVILDDGLDDAALLVLLAHDPDPFNRWEAGQRLALARMQRALAAHALPHLDDAFVDAMRHVLRHPQLAPAFKELVLTLPSEAYVAETLAEVDPQRLHAVREGMRAQLATRLHADWVWAWETHQVREGYRPDMAQSGARALANLALSMLCLHAVEVGDPVWPGRAYQRVKDAGNMTERLGALRALVHAHAELAQPALERFHAMFRGEALVIDKWFALQAGAPERDGAVFTRVKALLAHPDFTLANPNRARSLLHMFCQHNAAGVHRADGAGVRFWAERLLELDAKNPQLASRLARAMDRWRHLAEPYRSLARDAIASVAARPTLSNDVREIVTRALED
ncbi:aminopeptidase N [Calidifontimicrobium sp. SYSU G02091]|uniref:aminopeptidase N n=1 Tax=Calidifontimicrobium sp. SYSU G02091 TaxID=2926421 RepID=UPI001F53B428|nr:aminopeptidase N [Calidifontimicrobium sp. SYSU G02091]MCI1192717.1 aminopeptidase N [Calidifontimicrobium sp. SYSU G02091]